MDANLQAQLQPPRVKVCVFRTRVYYARNDERFRLNPLPKEITRIARDLEGKEVWAVLFALDREVTITLPWTVVKRIKHLILNEAKDEKDIRDALGFLAFDVVNTYLRLILPSVPTVLYRDPEHLEVKRIQVEGIEGIWLKATGFTVWPTAEGEKVTNAIAIEMELYNIPDNQDAFAHSNIVVKINLRELLNELNIRWDISRQ